MALLEASDRPRERRQIVLGADGGVHRSTYGDRIMTRIIYLAVLLVGLLVAGLCGLVAAPARLGRGSGRRETAGVLRGPAPSAA
jgi:uncharacterized membrane protein YedE/YeeE